MTTLAARWQQRADGSMCRTVGQFVCQVAARPDGLGYLSAVIRYMPSDSLERGHD